MSVFFQDVVFYNIVGPNIAEDYFRLNTRTGWISIHKSLSENQAIDIYEVRDYSHAEETGRMSRARTQ